MYGNFVKSFMTKSRFFYTSLTLSHRGVDVFEKFGLLIYLTILTVKITWQFLETVTINFSNTINCYFIYFLNNLTNFYVKLYNFIFNLKMILYIFKIKILIKNVSAVHGNTTSVICASYKIVECLTICLIM